MTTHGTRTAYVAGCRCDDCRTANREYARHNNRMRAYGRTSLVDAAPVRAHIRELMAAGVGWRRVAQLAGLPESTIYGILWGFYGQGKHHRPPRRRVTRATADAIMSTRVDLAPHALIDATGTRRRLQALVAAGNTQTALAAALGMTPGNFAALLTRTRVTRATADAVRALYDTAWNPTHPNQRAQNHARRRGWPPPLAWDDDEIDDPTATPDLGDTTPRRDARREDAAWLHACGYTPDEIARRLGIQTDSLTRYGLR